MPLAITLQERRGNMVQNPILPDTAPIPSLERGDWIARNEMPSRRVGARKLLQLIMLMDDERLLSDAGHVTSYSSRLPLAGPTGIKTVN